METPTQQGGDLDVDQAAQMLLQRRSAASAAPKEAEEVETPEVETPEPTDEALELQESDSAEDHDDEQEEDATEVEAAPQFHTLEELAEALEMDLDDFLSTVKTRTKVDGEESEVTLAELRKGYQLEANNTRKSQALSEAQKTFEAEQAEARAKINEQLNQAGQAFGFARQELLQEYNSINWAELEKTDPTEYMLLRQKYGDRSARIDAAIHQAAQAAQQVLDEKLAKENELLLKAIPDWKDDKVRSKSSTEVTEYLSAVGFTPDEISNITDHRYIVLARQALAASKQATAADIATKRVKKSPKLVKPSAPQDKATTKSKHIASLQQRFKKSGKTEDLAQLLLAKQRG